MEDAMSWVACAERLPGRPGRYLACAGPCEIAAGRPAAPEAIAGFGPAGGDPDEQIAAFSRRAARRDRQSVQWGATAVIRTFLRTQIEAMIVQWMRLGGYR